MFSGQHREVREKRSRARERVNGTRLTQQPTFDTWQGTILSRRTRAPVTALPQGINIVTFFAFSQLIMAPTYDAAIRAGDTPEQAARLAYDTGLCSNVLLAALELIGILFVEFLRAHIPRAAMLAAISGVALTYIAMGFMVQVHPLPSYHPTSYLLPHLHCHGLYGTDLRGSRHRPRLHALNATFLRRAH